MYELYVTQAVKRDNGSFKNVDLLRDQERVVLEVSHLTACNKSVVSLLATIIRPSKTNLYMHTP